MRTQAVIFLKAHKAYKIKGFTGGTKACHAFDSLIPCYRTAEKPCKIKVFQLFYFQQNRRGSSRGSSEKYSKMKGKMYAIGVLKRTSFFDALRVYKEKYGKKIKLAG